MHGRFLVIGTIVGALAVFVWQTLSNTALPWHEMTLRTFADDSSAVRAIQGAAPRNGIYYSDRGVLAVVAVAPGAPAADTMQAMLPRMGTQLVIDLAMALLLALVVSRIPIGDGLAGAVTLGFAGLAAGIVVQGSDWNWYGFPPAYAIVNAIDLTIQFFLAGLVLTMLARRLVPRARTQEMAGVPAGAAYPGASTGRGAAAR